MMTWSRASRTFLAAMLAVAISAAPAFARRRYLTPTTAEDFQKLLAQLVPEAENYAQAPGDAAPAPSGVMRNVQYTLASAGQLRQALRTKLKDPQAQLYLAYQLLQPLPMAGDDLLLKLRPTLTDMLQRCQYQSMPTWPRATIQLLKQPRKRLPRHLAQLREKRRRAALAQKRTAEQAIVKQNRMANALEKLLKSLLVLMGDEKASQAMLERLSSEVRRRWCTYRYTLEAVRNQAVHMKQDQAKSYYDHILRLAREASGQRHYADPTQPEYRDDGNSSFRSQRLHFAAEALKVVNLLATAARQPAVLLPGEKPPKKKHRRR
ncbi:MAG: hypothetical protein B1H04_02420 [Planctomycetales bacterium 4484_123]|nr:MAG: hypothetical protein B1H04_02420 [Planctomycetales bacterium 4484_123]